MHRARVCVVYMNCNFVGEIVKRTVYSHVVADNALAGSRNEKIRWVSLNILPSTWLSARIQYLGNGFGICVFLYCFHVLSLGKQSHIKADNILRFPQS